MTPRFAFKVFGGFAAVLPLVVIGQLSLKTVLLHSHGDQGLHVHVLTSGRAQETAHSSACMKHIAPAHIDTCAIHSQSCPHGHLPVRPPKDKDHHDAPEDGPCFTFLIGYASVSRPHLRTCQDSTRWIQCDSPGIDAPMNNAPALRTGGSAWSSRPPGSRRHAIAEIVSSGHALLI